MSPPGTSPPTRSPSGAFTTAFLYSSVIFVVAAAVAGLVLPRGNMRAL